ncbi:MAG: branched-chain amino acid aminotransferase [Proteobacteria bacterium]|nr:branched-chain amino acid aminotransferase [Pseudomonadota bacterium]
MRTTKTLKSRKHAVDYNNLGFGQHFSDHMFSCNYKNGKWDIPQIVPYGSISVSPSICSLHYGQIVFEGLKAFYAGDKINIFRPEKYHERFNRSCLRLCIPPVEYDLFIEGIKELVMLDGHWVPKSKGTSLYIRPFIFATDDFLGVRASDTYCFLIITSPVGAYYKEGINPVRLITSGEYTRAAKGGLGEAKTPANYAASLLPAQLAQAKGFTQVLWLDGVENRFIEEVGTMNIFFMINNRLITPSLEGTILSGVTRDSVIVLAKEWGIPVEERRVSIDELISSSKKGLLQEVFGTGTAAVISPVGEIRHEEETIIINNKRIGDLSQRLYDEITGIQYGEKEDRFSWRLSFSIPPNL